MKVLKKSYTLLIPVFVALVSLYITGCDRNPTETSEMTDNEYIQSIVNSGYDNNITNEDNLMSQEYNDLNDGGPLFDNDGSINNSPVDSLYKWGRRITGINRDFNISNSGDTLKTVTVTTTFTGNYIILGYVNGVLDTIIKPYTEVLARNAIFKRVNNSSHPRLNWRLYQISPFDGQTTQPQNGSSQVQITKIEFYVNNASTPTYTLNGPDFTSTYFTTKYFGGSGIPVLDRNDQVKVKIYTTSQLAPADYVAFHWAKNTYGFHRIPFELESQTGSGPYYRVYSKTFGIYGHHMIGAFNAYFSASTHESLYDSDISKFASDIIGIP
ncbi:MAG: hypothetical protein LWX07_13525, partial [Bacteroidetes bacterium]|nr:hypothetical protein [Bacteroidota bacterium]